MAIWCFSIDEPKRADLDLDATVKNLLPIFTRRNVQKQMLFHRGA
jgi:hypothetical protein